MKNFSIGLRIDDDTKSALDFLATEWAVTWSEAIRRALVVAVAVELKQEHE